MDWGVRLLGLDDKFLTKSGVGGGVIQVRPFFVAIGILI